MQLTIKHQLQNVRTNLHGLGARLEQESGKPLRASAASLRGGITFLLLDLSSSMGGEKIAGACTGAHAYAKKAIAEGQRVGLAVFHSRAEMLCPLTTEMSAIASALNRVKVDGSTNLTAGLEIVREAARCQEMRRSVCVVTDGSPDSKSSALGVAQEMKNEGIIIIALGTEDADHEFLKQLASSPEAARKTESRQLATALGGMTQVLQLAAGAAPRSTTAQA